MVVVNKGLKIGPRSRECATECGVDGVIVNKSFVEDMLFIGVWLGAVSGDGCCEQGA